MRPQGPECSLHLSVCHHVRAPWLGPVSAPLSFCAGCHWRSHLLSIKGAYGNSGHHQDRCKPTRPRRQPVKEMGCEGQATKPVAMHPLAALHNQEHKVSFVNPDVQEPSRPTSGARAFFAMGVSCARQPPWSPPTGCQEHLPGLTPKHGSGHCQPLEGDSVPDEKLCLLRKEPMGITLNQTGLKPRMRRTCGVSTSLPGPQGGIPRKGPQWLFWEGHKTANTGSSTGQCL